MLGDHSERNSNLDYEGSGWQGGETKRSNACRPQQEGTQTSFGQSSSKPSEECWTPPGQGEEGVSPLLRVPKELHSQQESKRKRQGEAICMHGHRQMDSPPKLRTYTFTK